MGLRALLRLLATLALALGLQVAPGGAQPVALDDPVAEAIRLKVEQAREQGSIWVGDLVLSAPAPLLEIYERRAFQPLWSAPAAAELLRFVQAVGGDGLRPDHYHVDELARRGRGDAGPPEEAASTDLLRTAAFLQVGLDLSRGRVDPRELDATWRVERPTPAALEADSVAAAITSGAVLRALDRLRPAHPIYRRMMRALADYRRVEAEGGWAAFPLDLFLDVDSSRAEVAALRSRLVKEGDLPAGTDTVSPVFDATVAEGVRRFQHRHGLNQDGVVGRATLAALNVPASQRVSQLRANLERARWVLGSLADTFVAVNVAGQMVYMVRGDSVVLEARAVVGRDYTRTPVFSAPMRYLVANPTWTVPRSINGEILAKLPTDPGYLEREGFQVLDPSGRPVALDQVDFQRYSGGSFPWVFRQQPGPTNALGRIKFMFPNEFNVYLHDTPSRSLFAREERLFSHGCIRVENPLALAHALLGPAERGELQRLLEAGETGTVDLPRPVPVLVLYWTAAADLHGEVHFYRDIYGRDPPLLDALDRAPADARPGARPRG